MRSITSCAEAPCLNRYSPAFSRERAPSTSRAILNSSGDVDDALSLQFVDDLVGIRTLLDVHHLVGRKRAGRARRPVGQHHADAGEKGHSEQEGQEA